MASEPGFSIAQHLIELLNARTGSRSLAYASPPRRLAGGFSADTYAFEILDPPPMLSGPLVLRLMRNDDDARRETIVHRAVADSGFPAPRIHLAGSAGDAFGRPFLIANFAHGSDAVREWGVRRAFRELPSVLAGIMAQLHCLDAESIAEELEAVGWSQDRLGPRGVLTDIEAALDDTMDSELSRQLDRLRSESADLSTPHLPRRPTCVEHPRPGWPRDVRARLGARQGDGPRVRCGADQAHPRRSPRHVVRASQAFGAVVRAARGCRVRTELSRSTTA